MNGKTTNNQALIENAYAAFNARDIDTLLQLMHPQIKWTKAWEGSYANGHNEVKDYWLQQWQEINPKVVPVGLHNRENGTLEVEVDQTVKDLTGHVLFHGRVKHIYVIEEGLLKQMDVEIART
jgi:hypothetical protein